MTAAISSFLRDEDGATAIEYGILAAIMGIGLVFAFTAFGDSLISMFGVVSGKSTSAMVGGP
ncbi:MAG: Flp family type IVb pilin [Devosia sp.]